MKESLKKILPFFLLGDKWQTKNLDGYWWWKAPSLPGRILQTSPIQHERTPKKASEEKEEGNCRSLNLVYGEKIQISPTISLLYFFFNFLILFLFKNKFFFRKCLLQLLFYLILFINIQRGVLTKKVKCNILVDSGRAAKLTVKFLMKMSKKKY